jgi:hypothetical protein
MPLKKNDRIISTGIILDPSKKSGQLRCTCDCICDCYKDILKDATKAYATSFATSYGQLAF